MRKLLTVFVLLAAFAIANRVEAQSSASITKRLTDLEAQVASLVNKVGALQAENSAQAATITALQSAVAALGAKDTAQDALITALRNDLNSEIANRVNGDNAAKAYTDSQVAATLAAAKTYADSKVNVVADKLVHFSRTGNEVYITGANVHIRNGTGGTYQTINGLGNLTLGYNEGRGNGGDARTGSHNLILGFGQNYTSAGGIVAGAHNTSSDFFASILGGTGNTASGLYSTVSGGYNNTGSGDWSTIGGGQNQVAPNTVSHIP